MAIRRHALSLDTAGTLQLPVNVGNQFFLQSNTIVSYEKAKTDTSEDDQVLLLFAKIITEIEDYS